MGYGLWERIDWCRGRDHTVLTTLRVFYVIPAKAGIQENLCTQGNSWYSDGRDDADRQSSGFTNNPFTGGRYV
ncbi:MAG TPA: hypothetical protein DDZ40_12765 [Deltaproteobacteria bacterium]|nr:hypothetical protein [Deltaproteobacteria bacterium]